MRKALAKVKIAVDPDVKPADGKHLLICFDPKLKSVNRDAMKKQVAAETGQPLITSALQTQIDLGMNKEFGLEAELEVELAQVVDFLTRHPCHFFVSSLFCSEWHRL